MLFDLVRLFVDGVMNILPCFPLDLDRFIAGIGFYPDMLFIDVGNHPDFSVVVAAGSLHIVGDKHHTCTFL